MLECEDPVVLAPKRHAVVLMTSTPQRHGVKFRDDCRGRNERGGSETGRPDVNSTSQRVVVQEGTWESEWSHDHMLTYTLCVYN